MTEMVYGSSPIRVTEPILSRWWRTIDKWSLTAVLVLFGVGLGLIYLPAGLIGSGAVIMAVALFGPRGKV